MAKQLLTVNGEGLSGSNKKFPMIKTYSFATDDDDISVDNSKPVSKHDKLLSMNVPSMDSNTNEDDVSDRSSKHTKRKSQRQSVRQNRIENKRLSIEKTPWYKKIGLLKPLMIIGILVVLYLMWIKRDIWIPRLLTSSTRIPRSAVKKTEQIITESTTTTTILSKNSPLTSSSLEEEDAIENIEEKNEMENNENSIPSSTKSSSSQKINIRVRRNKMSFNKERQKKKYYHSPGSSVDDDDNNDDDEEDDEDKPEPVLLSSIHSTKKHQHRSIIENEISESLLPLNSALSFSTYDDIIQQLRKNLKLRNRNKDFLSILSKTTGLNKDKLYRFIYKKDYQLMTLQEFMSLLDSFNLMLLIVPK